jgi:hypothetical protein
LGGGLSLGATDESRGLMLVSLPIALGVVLSLPRFVVEGLGRTNAFWRNHWQ